MATKEQELKALEQIRKIVSSLGDYSYIATAFAGCFEIAESNIEYDLADSWKGRCEVAEQQTKDAREMVEELKNKLDMNEKSRMDDTETMNKEFNRLNEQIKTLKAQVKSLTKQDEEKANTIMELRETSMEQGNRIEKAEATVTKLKAKLFDLMIGE